MYRSKDGASHRSITRGSDFLQLKIDDAPLGGRSDWLARQLRLAIADGRLPAGSKLPPTRILASEPHVSRGVITDAYRRLVDHGHVVGRGRAGTVVVAAPVPASPPSLSPGPPLSNAPFTGELGVDIFDSLRAVPARIDLSPGLPDVAAFPRAAWLRAERSLLGAVSASDLGYGAPRGTAALRNAVAGWLARNRGIRVAASEVLIVSGVAQALGLVAQVLRDDGICAVAVEDPGSLGARQHLRSWLLDTPPVSVDAEGIRLDELRASDAPAVLLTSAHLFPTGVVLGGERRRGLMSWASDGGFIIEDDYDAEHRYDRPAVPALRSMLAERVAYAGSVSKLLAPALRLGWVLAPPKYRDVLVVAKRFADLGNAALPQLVLARLIESGAMERHLRLLRRRHRRRRDVMIESIRTHLPGATVHGSAAGLHLLVTFEAGFADVDLAAAALERGVKVQPLSLALSAPELAGARPGLRGERAECHRRRDGDPRRRPATAAAVKTGERRARH
jgi:GntR family transcriptional regulator/MocR family aminotransferase